MSTTEKSIAHLHSMNHFGTDRWPDGQVPWSEAKAPVWPPGEDGKYNTTGRLRSCGYCGSMHPADVAAAIKAGATGHFADWKYGWPHKLYFDGVPYPFAGQLESRSSKSHPTPEELESGEYIKVQDGFDSHTGDPYYTYKHKGQPAKATSYEKFYTVHLQDATPEDREIIEKHLGLAFTFEGTRISWKPAQ